MERIEDFEQVVGAAAVLSLQARDLLPTAAVPSQEEVVVACNGTADLLAGIATGSALGQQRIDHRLPWAARAERLIDLGRLSRRTEQRAEAQTARLAAEVWRRGEWTAAERLSDELVLQDRRLRKAGRALRATVQHRREGRPWFEAGVGSFGNGALTRAVPIGALFAAAPATRALASSVDAAVTHATPLATASARFVADLTAALTNADVDVAAVVRREVAETSGELRRHLDDGLASPLDERAMRRLGLHPAAPNTLAVVAAVLATVEDPVQALATVASLPGDRDGLAALAGGLLAAAHGLVWIPDSWAAGRPDGRAAAGARADGPVGDGTPSVWFLLDRSGSMSSIAPAVESGFDEFFAGQRASEGDVDVTVVQFDSGDIHEVLVDRQSVETVPSMRGRFEPRGMTPLLDAVDLLLDRAERCGVHDADQLVVIFTDGHENASTHTSRQALDRRINALRDRGWTFLFLGANQDSFDSAAGLGMGRGSARDFRASGSGVQAAYADLDRATTIWKQRSRHERLAHRDDYWEQVTSSRREG